MAQQQYGLSDLHCDTVLEMYQRNIDFDNTELHISFDKMKDYPTYTQVMAIWSSPRRTDDENFSTFRKCRSYMLEHLSHHPELALCASAAELQAAWDSHRTALVLGVEGGSLLGEDLSRVNMMYECGVRFFTLVWGGVTRMGGAHDIGGPLSPFGVKALRRAISLGIIPDVSHASREIFDTVAEESQKAGRPFVATHSNSAVLCGHTRNLTDEQFKTLRDAGGLVGANYYRAFLVPGEDKYASVSDLVDHIEHFLMLGGEHTMCLGSDSDGIDAMPSPMKGQEDAYMIADEMARRNYSERLIGDIMENNVHRFLLRWL